MKILVDENIPAAGACFGQFGTVSPCNGRALDAAAVKSADVLIVRSVTQVNAELLAGSAVKFVGSCTIGMDHLDQTYLQQCGIRYCNAPGSNAASVVDYVLSAIVAADDTLERLLAGESLGIVGLGNVGSRLARRMRGLGIPCLAFDPYVAQSADAKMVALDALKDCSVLCLHTPLIREGEYPTQHMLSADWLEALPQNALLLNAGRGEVLDTVELLSLAQSRPDIQLVLDVWENEPDVAPELARRCLFATPHIAGYSADGKINGLLQIAETLAGFLNTRLAAFDLPPAMRSAPRLRFRHTEVAESIRDAVRQIYDIRNDHQRFMQTIQSANPAVEFDLLRRTYPLRRELASACFEPGSSLDISLQRRLFAALCDGV